MFMHNIKGETVKNIQNKDISKTKDTHSLPKLSTATKLEYVPIKIISHTSSDENQITDNSQHLLKLPHMSHYSSLKPSGNKEYLFKLNKIKLLSKLGPLKSRQKIFRNSDRNLMLQNQPSDLSHPFECLKGAQSPMSPNKSFQKIEPAEKSQITGQLSPKTIPINYALEEKDLKRQKLSIDLSDEIIGAGDNVNPSPKLSLNERLSIITPRKVLKHSIGNKKIFFGADFKNMTRKPKIKQISNSSIYSTITGWENYNKDDSLYPDS
ncbi:unnamed protein product [Blepharisma stoltei]|uniref:Exophilin 5 n=1 Tax=Blepharisma stoltei TaxID=1481888 RepID=A0AAU9JS53_9CILI|nr:unnamed protein product [Blepharisma stoltei]